MPAFPKRLTAHFATNRDFRNGRFEDEFNRKGSDQVRLGTVDLSKSGKNWKVGKPNVFPERSRAADDTSRAQRVWVQKGSTKSFDMVRKTGIEDKTSDILIFLHGAANDFGTAAETLGLMTELYSEGSKPLLPYFFTYPANGSSDPMNYLFDRRDATHSGGAIARSFGKLINFLLERKIEERCGARIHLIAHSLGVFALRRAVEEIFTFPAYRPVRLFDTVFLAHGDDDEDTLASPQKMLNLTRLTDRIVVYYDGTDKMLRLSDSIHLDRLGQKGPNPFPGPHVNGCDLAAVDCSGVGFDLTPDRQRHRHYLRASKVIEDIKAVMRYQTPDRTAQDDRPGFWRL